MSYIYFGNSFFPATYWQDLYWGSYVVVTDIPLQPDFPGIEYTSSSQTQIHYTFNDTMFHYISVGESVDYTFKNGKAEYLDSEF